MRLEIPPEALEGAPAPQTAGNAAKAFRVRAPREAPVGLGGTEFQQLLQNVYDAALITDLQGRIEDANTRAAQFLHLTGEELRGLSVLDVISGASEALMPKLRESLSQSRYILLQAYCVRADASLFPSEIAINRLTLSGQEHLCFFMRDIGWRKQAEDQLRVEHVAMQNAGSGLAIADAEGRILYVNPAVVRLFGAESVDIFTNQIITSIFDPPDEIQAAVTAVLDHGCWSGELALVRPNGDPVYIQASATVVRDTEETITGMVFSFSDVTDRCVAEQQLERNAGELRERNAQMEADLTMAREVQMGLLPDHLPCLPAGAPPERQSLRCARFYRPSATVGGDFFHVQPLGERAVGVFVCDVMGHGMRAALVTAIVRGLLEESRALCRDPGALLSRLNQALVDILRPSGEFLFVSAVYAIVDLEQAAVRMALAGHPAPLRVRSSLPAPEALFERAARGPALGVRENHAFACTTHPIQAGDRLLFYTDGLIESENSLREEWGVERLCASLQTHAALPLDAWIAAIVAESAGFGEGRPFEDDVCAVGLEIASLS